MNKFEKAQKVLHELKSDGWLIVCSEDSDVNSRFLIGVESHARHYIYVAKDGKHKVLAVEMEAPMIERSLKSRGIDVEFPEDLKVMRGTTKKQIFSLKTNEDLKWEISLKPIEAGDYIIKINIKFMDSDQNKIEETKDFPFSIKL